MSQVGERLFYAMDGPGGNGIITWDEFLPQIQKIGWNSQTAMQMWYTVDQDRSGSLDKGEFLRFCQNPSVSPFISEYEKRLPAPPPPVGAKAFAYIDGQGSGPSDGRVQWSEFCPLILKIGWNQQTALQMWYTQDTDRSGYLSKAEFITFCNRPDVKPYMEKAEANLPGGTTYGAPSFGAPSSFGAPTTTTTTTTSQTKEVKTDESGGSYSEKCTRSVDTNAMSEASKKLRKAMKGFGTNEKALNEVIAPKSTAEMQEIRKQFTVNFKRDLIKDLKSETSGNYEDILVALTMDTPEYDAYLVRKACKGLGTNEALLSEVLATRSPEDIKLMIAAYKRLYGKDVITVVEGETSGNLEKIYCTLLNGSRTMGSDVDGDVDKLYKAGEKKFGTDEGVFIRILGGYRREYVEKLYWAYATKHGKALDRVVRSEFSGNLKKVLEILCTPLEIYWSREFKDSIKGIGTDEDKLTRCVRSTKERVMRKTAKRFLQDNSKTLLKWADGDTSGDYGKLICATIQHWGKLS